MSGGARANAGRKPKHDMSLDMLLSYEVEGPAEDLLPPQLPTPNILVQKKVAEAKMKRLEKVYAARVETLKGWDSSYHSEWDKMVEMRQVLQDR